MPDTDEHRRQFKLLQNEIVTLGGDATLMDVDGFDHRDDERLISYFNDERNLEYQEFLGKCADYLGEINHETEIEHFTYAELQENDEDLKKLKGWLEKIRKVDFYGAPFLSDAQTALGECEKSLEVFARQVFEAEERR